MENTTVRTLLGPGLYDWLEASYLAPDFDRTDANSLAAELLRLVQAPIARLGTAAGLAGHQVSISGTGVHIMTTETSKTAFQWQVNQLRATLERRGQSDLDTLLQWLEDHREVSVPLQGWAGSAAGQRHRRELFTHTLDFQEYENISASRPVFLGLGPVRRRLESFEVGRVLGADFLQELRDQVRTRTLTSDNENLLRTYVYPALASLTIGHAIPELGLKLAGDGIELTIARVDDANAKEADAGLDQLLRNKMNEALMTGARHLRRLTTYLDSTASASRFATYFGSSAYTKPAPAEPRNLPTTRVYRLF
ncbi:DUF6712 family protein [Hymenobacter humi]|uniref:DUF6712 family protein n=1 Tax=Hymenobacter humi TaxID=1411620 RepID=A0ABW2U7N9_9BACT